MSAPPANVASAKHQAPKWIPLGPGLPRLSSNGPPVSQVVCDQRFQQWVASVLQDPNLSVTLRTCRAPLWMLEVETAEGVLRLGLAAQGLPAALVSALRASEPGLACEAATLMLQELLDQFQPVMNAARVRSIVRSDKARVGFVFNTQGTLVALLGADTRLRTHVVGLVRGLPAQLPAWNELRVAGRLRLATRHWSAAFLASISHGDVVLLPPPLSAQTWIVGSGTSLQAPAQVDMPNQRIQVIGDPYMANDEVAVPPSAPGRFEDLQLPVAFEIDTARVSLSELATIRPDYLVELDVPLSEATVRLICHGQTIGQGQLVTIGEHLGVRITYMGIRHGLDAGA